MKILIQIILTLLVIGFTNCEQPENSPPYGPTTLNMRLLISDKDGYNLILGNVTVDKDHVLTSPYKLTGTYNGITKETKMYAYFDSNNNVLGIRSILNDFEYGKAGSLTGIITYKMQLSTVFGDDRVTTIEVEWKVKEITDWPQSADVSKVRVNGEEAVYNEKGAIVITVDN